MAWKGNFGEGKEVVLCTASKSGRPNANVVISLGLEDGKLLIADCQMKATMKNIKENPKIVVIGGYFRINGAVELSTSGKYFDMCVARSEGYKVRHAILVTIESVYDLDNQEVVFP